MPTKWTDPSVIVVIIAAIITGIFTSPYLANLFQTPSRPEVTQIKPVPTNEAINKSTSQNVSLLLKPKNTSPQTPVAQNHNPSEIERIATTNQIQDKSTQYIVTKKWGDYGSADGRFNGTNGLAVDSSGNVYVADGDNDRVQKFNSNGTFITKWGISGNADGQFYHPDGIATDLSGNIFVGDSKNNRVQKFDSNGNFITKIGIAFTPRGLAVDSSNDVYVSDYLSRIQKFSLQP